MHEFCSHRAVPQRSLNSISGVQNSSVQGREKLTVEETLHKLRPALLAASIAVIVFSVTTTSCIPAKHSPPVSHSNCIIKQLLVIFSPHWTSGKLQWPSAQIAVVTITAQREILSCWGERAAMRLFHPWLSCTLITVQSIFNISAVGSLSAEFLLRELQDSIKTTIRPIQIITSFPACSNRHPAGTLTATFLPSFNQILRPGNRLLPCMVKKLRS